MRDRFVCVILFSLRGYRLQDSFLLSNASVDHPVAVGSSGGSPVKLGCNRRTVSDSSGAVIPDAQIALTNTDTGTQQQTEAERQAFTRSLISVPGIIVGSVQDWFCDRPEAGIILQVNQTATLDLSLNTGSSEQTVTVSGQLSPLESSTAELGTVISTKPVNDLPLNGRNFTQLLTLTPGVSPISVGQNAGGGGGWAETRSVPSHSLP